LGQVFL